MLLPIYPLRKQWIRTLSRSPFIPANAERILGIDLPYPLRVDIYECLRDGLKPSLLLLIEILNQGKVCFRLNGLESEDLTHARPLVRYRLEWANSRDSLVAFPAAMSCSESSTIW